MGGCSGAHSSPEQYTGLPATPPHKGGCLATGTYRPMAAGPGPAAPDGCTAGPHSRAIGGRLLVSRRDTHVPARAGAGRSRTPRALGAQQHSSKRCVAAPKEPPGCQRPQAANHASWPAACPAAATLSRREGSRAQLGTPSACHRRRRREQLRGSRSGAGLRRRAQPPVCPHPPRFFHTLAASAHVMSGKQPSKLSAHHP